MNLSELTAKGRSVVQQREEGSQELGLSPEFLEGFREGVAELIGSLSGESASEVLEFLSADMGDHGEVRVPGNRKDLMKGKRKRR